MRIKQALFYYLIMISVLSCEFESKKDFFVDIKEPVSKSSFNLDDLPDSVYIFEHTKINYRYSPNGHRLYKVIIQFDDKTLVNNDIHSGTFEIEPSVYTNGLHTLKVTFYTSTESGSFADRLDLEYFSLEKEYKIYIDNVPPIMPQIKSAIIRDGSVYFEFTETDKFTYYSMVLKCKYSCNNTITKFPVKKGQYSFRDSVFSGGKAEYTLEMEGYKYFQKSNTVELDTLSFQIKSQITDFSNLYFSWQKFPLYGNVSSMEISMDNHYQRIEVNDSGSISIPYELRFGERVTPVISLNDGQFCSFSMPDILIGEKSPEYISSTIAYEKTTDCYYVIGRNSRTITTDPSQDNYYLYKVKRSNFEVLKFKLIGRNIRPEQIQISLSDGLPGYYLKGTTLYSFDLQNLNTVVVSAGIPVNHQELYYLKIGSNSRMFVLDYESAKVINLDNNEVLYEFYDYNFDLAASVDGNHFFVGNTLYKLTDTDTVKLVSFTGENHAVFHPGDPDVCFVQRNYKKTIELYDLKTLTSAEIMKDASIEGGFLRFDSYQPDYIGIDNWTTFIWYNYKQKKQEKLPLVDYNSFIYFYSGGRIFSIYGYCYEFKLF